MRRPGFTGSADPSKRAGHACDPSEGEEQLDGGVLNQLRREPLHAPGVAGVLTIQHLGPAKRHGSRIADGHRVLGGGWDAMTPSLSAGRRQGRPGLDRSLDSPILGEDSVKSRSPECVAEPMGVFCVARTASMWATPHPVTTRPLPFARQGVSGPDQSMAPLGTRLRMGSVSVRWERTGKNGEERGRTGKKRGCGDLPAGPWRHVPRRVPARPARTLRPPASPTRPQSIAGTVPRRVSSP